LKLTKAIEELSELSKSCKVLEERSQLYNHYQQNLNL